jgi:hypothetical protein
MISPEKLLRAGFGHINTPVLPTGSVPIGGSASANNSATLNSTIGNTVTKVIAAHPAFGVRVRRIRLVVNASFNVAYCFTAAGASTPTMTAVGDGTSTDGTLIIPQGSPVIIERSLSDRVDMWLVGASATDSTAYQIELLEM